MIFSFWKVNVNQPPDLAQSTYALPPNNMDTSTNTNPEGAERYYSHQTVGGTSHLGLSNQPPATKAMLHRETYSGPSTATLWGSQAPRTGFKGGTSGLIREGPQTVPPSAVEQGPGLDMLSMGAGMNVDDPMAPAVIRSKPHEAYLAAESQLSSFTNSKSGALFRNWKSDSYRANQQPGTKQDASQEDRNSLFRAITLTVILTEGRCRRHRGIQSIRGLTG